MAGVFLALMLGLSGAPAGAWRGELVMLAATFCMSLYNVWSRPFIARSDPLAFLTAGMGAAAVCLLVWALLIDGFDAVAAFRPAAMARDCLSRRGRQRAALSSFGCSRSGAPARPRRR